MNTHTGPGTIRQNVFYGVLDYASQPVMMVMTAPVLLRTLGVRAYGTWMLINAITAIASGLGGGFGDGATRFISMYRGRNDHEGVTRSLTAALAINCVLGSLLTISLIVSAPLLLGRILNVDPGLRREAVVALRISAAVLALRFVEAVFMSAVRAYERYRPVVVTSVGSRVTTLTFAMVLAERGHGLASILWATLAVEALTLVLLGALTRHILNLQSVPPIAVIAGTGVQEIFNFGAFTWLKSAMGVLFGHADRLMVAALLGAGPLALYVLCNQLAQIVPSLLVAGFNFIFPHFSARSASGRWAECKKNYRKAVIVAASLATAVCVPMIFAAHRILVVWLGPAAATECFSVLIALIIGNGLLAITVVPQYTALAFGRPRAVLYMNLAAGVVSMIGAYVLLRQIGLVGGGLAKISAGLVSLSSLVIVADVFRNVETIENLDQDTATVTSLGPIGA
jgi:O-antigen/teichoic acid export membrane protein